MRKPDFMVVGTQKAGTTWLFECLNEHPEVFVPALKEVHYFCPPEACRHSRRSQGMDWYLDLFPDDPAIKAAGELTTDYMLYPGVAEELHALNPDMKIVFMLRHPVDRAYSAYWMQRRYKPAMPPFEEWLTTQPGALDRGFYHRQIEPYLRLFGAANLRIYIYEELFKEPRAFFADLCRFLGADDAFVPASLTQKVGDTKNIPPWLGVVIYKVASPIINLPVVLPLWRFMRNRLGVKDLVLKLTARSTGGDGYRPMAAAERSRLLALYREENARLFQLIGRDLPQWET